MNILAAREKVKDKKVIYDKLGKTRVLVGYIKTVGEAVKDVGTTCDSIIMTLTFGLGTPRCRCGFCGAEQIDRGSCRTVARPSPY